MPRVPVYGEQKVEQKPIPSFEQQSVSATATSAGALMGQQLQEIGAQASALGQRAYLQIRAQRAQQAEDAQRLSSGRQMAELENQLMNPQDGALATKGQDTLALRDSVLPKWDSETEKIGASITNPRAKTWFQENALARREQMAGRIDDHTAREMDAYTKGQFDAGISASINTAVNNYDDVGRVSAEIANLHSMIGQYGPRLGLTTDEQRAQAFEQARSQIHVGVVNQFLAHGQAKNAKAYFEEVTGKSVDSPSTWGNRLDGSPKGEGYFGPLQRPGGGVMTEYSTGVVINGQETEIPLLVPTLTEAEARSVLSNQGDAIPEPIITKAIEYARQRIADGKSPFAQQGEANRTQYPALSRQGESQIDAKQLPELAARIYAKSDETESMRVAGEIWDKYKPTGDREPVAIDKMVNEARQRLAGDPDSYKYVEAFLHNQKATVDAARQSRDKASEDAIGASIARGSSLPSLMQTPQWDALPGEKKLSIAEFFQRRELQAEQRAATAAARADAADARAERKQEHQGDLLWYEYSQPDWLGKHNELDIQLLEPEVGVKTVGRLLDAKRQMQQHTETATVERQMLTEELTGAGIAYAASPKTAAQKATIGRADKEVRDRIVSAQRSLAQGGKQPVLSDDQKRDIIRDVAKQTVLVKGRIWGEDEVQSLNVAQADLPRVRVAIGKIPNTPDNPVVESYARELRRMYPTLAQTPTSKLSRDYQSRIEHAYGVRVAGGSDDQVRAALRGEF